MAAAEAVSSSRVVTLPDNFSIILSYNESTHPNPPLPPSRPPHMNSQLRDQHPSSQTASKFFGVPPPPPPSHPTAPGRPSDDNKGDSNPRTRPRPPPPPPPPRGPENALNVTDLKTSIRRQEPPAHGPNPLRSDAPPSRTSQASKPSDSPRPNRPLPKQHSPVSSRFGSSRSNSSFENGYGQRHEDHARPPPPPPPPPRHSLKPGVPGHQDREPFRSPNFPNSLDPEEHVNENAGSHTSQALSDRSASRDRLTSSSSEFEDSLSDDEDEFDQANRRFPPLMPTVQSRRAVTRRRSVITKKITSKVSRYEHVQRSTSDWSEAELDGSESSGDSEIDNVQALWMQLKEKRLKLNETKQEMASRRKELRELRRRKDEADNAFMNLLRPTVLFKSRRSATTDDLIEKRFAEMLTLRTEYHWLESAYEGLEVALDEEEVELNRLETRFFSMLAAGRTRSGREALRERRHVWDRDHEQPNLPEDLLGISPNGPSEDIHPLYQQLVSVIGDLGIAKESFADLNLQREQAVYEIDLRKNAGKPPSNEDIEFMKEYPSELQEKRRRVEQLTEEVADLKRLCIERGVMKKHLSFKDALALYPDNMVPDIGDDMSVDGLSDLHTLANPQFPMLLSQPDHVLRKEPLTAYGDLKQAVSLAEDDADKAERLNIAEKEYGIQILLRDFKAGDKLDFICRWLLYQLRTSPLEAEFLHTTFEDYTKHKIMNRAQWQENVLHYWWKDSAVGQIKFMTGHDTSAYNDSMGRLRSPTASKAASDPQQNGRRIHFDSDDGAKTVV